MNPDIQVCGYSRYLSIYMGVHPVKLLCPEEFGVRIGY